MLDYSNEFDAPAGESGPWITWLAAASRDGMAAAGTWVYRDFDTRQAIDLSQGFIADWPASRTGWTSGGGTPGVAPIRRWNSSRTRFEPRPGGAEWKKAFAIPIAYAPDAKATWDQGGAGVFNAFIAFMRILMVGGAPEQLPLLPLVRANGSKIEKFASGPSVVPVFELLRYVPRPACLPIEQAVSAPVLTPVSMPTPASLPPPQSVAQPMPRSPMQSVDWSQRQRPLAQPVNPAPQPGGWDAPAAARSVSRQETRGAATAIPSTGAPLWGAPEANSKPSPGGGLIDDEVPF